MSADDLLPKAPTAFARGGPGLDPASGTSTSQEVTADKLEVLEETLTVSKRQIATGTVRVTTHTQTRDEVAEVTLDRNVIEVIRVPVDRVVDVAPAVRTVGDTTIVPVLEERLVVVKQLVLMEELHIRHHVEHELSRTPVQLRRQTAVIKRLDANGQIVDDDPTLQ